MAWNLDSDRPIYLQIIEILQTRIVSGMYQAGDRLPSVRELAAEASVNPNTMQRAFAELERSGLILTQRTNGRTVTEDTALIATVRQNLAKEQIKLFWENMHKLGYEKQEISALLEQIKGEESV